LTAWDKCPHALEGKNIRVGSQGTNPYIYTDYDRNIVYNEKGLPLGEYATTNVRLNIDIKERG
jgi:hypothetical protein